MKRLLAAALCGALASCALPGHPVATFVGNDAGNAQQMARSAAANGDAAAMQRAQCYGAWDNIATGFQAVKPGTGGVFTGVEGGIEVQNTLQSQPCQSIAGQVLLWVMQKSPLAAATAGAATVMPLLPIP